MDVATFVSRRRSKRAVTHTSFRRPFGVTSATNARFTQRSLPLGRRSATPDGAKRSIKIRC
jgi:hypothetical protein